MFISHYFRNNSNMLICCSKKHFLLLPMLKTNMLIDIFVEMVNLFFTGFFDE